jgi:uncharacterized membrane protein
VTRSSRSAARANANRAAANTSPPRPSPAGAATSTAARSVPSPATPAAAPAESRWRERALPIVLVAAAVVGMIASGYLSFTHATGGLPACGPVQGCDTVALSPYSEILGVPVAYLGFAFSVVLFGLIVAWLRLADRRVLYAAYGLGLLGVVFVAYLTYLELFVIHAICIWCVIFAASVVTTWAALAVSLRRSA